MTNIYDDPRLKNAAARAMRDARENAIEHEVQQAPTFVGAVEWPTVPYYGFDHARETSELALQVYYRIPIHADLTPFESKVNELSVKYAGLYHDLGRTAPWNHKDPGHAQASASLAEEYLKTDNDLSRDDALREAVIRETCRLIANHSLDAPSLPTDPRAMALWDADSLEAARIEPGTHEGLRLLKHRYERLCTEWVKNKNLQSKLRQMRGWV
jgi:hypothetical protein